MTGSEKLKQALTMKSIVRALAPSLSVFIFWGIPLFLISGTWLNRNAWLFILTIAIAWGVIQLYLAKNDPGLFKKRQLRTEKKGSQQFILFLSTVSVIGAIIVSGFDYRYHWSEIPYILSLVFTGVMILGFVMLFYVLKQNTFASRTIEIQEEQRVIETGLYAWVRHPMYFSLIVVFLFTPVILGSWFAFFPIIFIPVLLTFRTKYEEKELQKGLKGYDEYMKKVKYRLIPFVW